jgi:cell division protein FtsB
MIEAKKLKNYYYKEEIARNELKMVKPGEVIYKVTK